MEERLPLPQRPTEARGPTVADEPAAPAGTPCDDALLAPVVQLLLSSSGENSSSSSSSDDDDEGERELDLEFEFPFVSRDSPAGTAAPADELFADGRIRTTFYPVFGRGAGCFSSSSSDSSHGGFAAPPAEKRVRGRLGKLFLEETRDRNSSTSSSSSSGAGTDDDGLEGAAPESYCVWRPGSSASPSPPPPRTRKSGSTGSMARWRRISDLVVGRSHSDGREKFLFLSAATTPAHDAPPRRKKPGPAPAPGPALAPAGARKAPPPPVVAAPATQADAAAAAHRIASLARAGLVGVPPGGGGTPRRTFLPYREELVGFFASVNGISRSHHHPF